MSCRVKVILHGRLKELCPSGLEFEGDSVAEVVNGLCRQTKAFNVNFDQPKHCVKVVGYDTTESLFEPFKTPIQEIHLVPQMGGGKGGGFFRVFIGAVLIAAAFFTGGASLAGTLAFGTTTYASLMFNLGLSLVLGGLLELISPAPKMDGSGNVQDPEGSKYLGASQNTVKIGTRIPLLYGEHMAYGQYLSFDVDAVDVAV